jgi:L-ascorbate metabolism protein UlaG (beta-lactamase superfamily)
MKRLRFTILGGAQQRDTATTSVVSKFDTSHAPSAPRRELPGSVARPRGRASARSKQWGMAMLTITIGTLGFALSVVLVAAILAVPRHSGPVSPHFDGKRFSNLAPFVEPSLVDILRWKLFTTDEEWPTAVAFPTLPPPPSRIAAGARVTFINHATVLLQLDGLNVLTDPVYSERLGPIASIGVARHKAPGIPFDQLPKIDVVLISHNHYDHLDVPTLRRLVTRDQPILLAGLGNRAFFEAEGLGARAVDLDLFESHDVAGVSFTFTPAQHWSARSLADRRRSLWGGFYVRGPSARIYFAGDTAAGPHFERIHERLGAPDVALLPIGAYAPRWFMRPQHIDPAEAVDAHLVLGAKTSIAIHFGCFDLASEGMLAPVEQLTQALATRKLPSERFLALEHGESFSLP